MLLKDAIVLIPSTYVDSSHGKSLIVNYVSESALTALTNVLFVLHKNAVLQSYHFHTYSIREINVGKEGLYMEICSVLQFLSASL